MSSSYGENIRLTIFGQSHGPAVGLVLEGIPAGFEIDGEKLQRFLDRRRGGQGTGTTPRREADRPVFLSGLSGGKTCGAPLALTFANENVRPDDYSHLADVPRPGHADYTAAVKYRGFQDASGGGHFSGRLTLPLCAAGGICLQLLEREGITVLSRIAAVGGVEDEGELTPEAAARPFPTASSARGEAMRALIREKQAEGDSVGGIVECAVLGIPAGLGDPIFDGMENRIARAVFGIPAVKGVEFGAGFGAAALCGSENNDEFCMEEGRVRTRSNRSGGILGGITDGMPLTFRAAFKPTPSISKPQRSISLCTGEETELRIGGRHDACIAIRAVPCVEAAAALAVYDAFLGRKKEQ
ncbi:MAG: chorismate synthase [Lachnospiraceae bacterium]|nr:chorismate synthase [Lachnospiraceae bacterium]